MIYHMEKFRFLARGSDDFLPQKEHTLALSLTDISDRPNMYDAAILLSV